MIGNRRTTEPVSVVESGPDAVPVAVVERIAAAKDCEVGSVPPLYRSVDPDALARLVAGGADGLKVSFSHAGCQVVVDGDGHVSVAD